MIVVCGAEEGFLDSNYLSSDVMSSVPPTVWTMRVKRDKK